MKYIVPMFIIFSTLAIAISLLGYKVAIGILIVSILAGFFVERLERWEKEQHTEER